MNNRLRAFSLVLAFIFLTVIAIGAGLGLAIWDTGSSVTEVSSIAFGSKMEPEIGEKQTIEIAEGSITDYIANGDNNDVKETSVDHSIKDNIEGGIEPQKGDTKEDALNEISENGGIASVVNSKAVSEEEVSAEENGESLEKVEEVKREPLKITSEISGIAKIVRAGDEGDSIENQLPAPAQITETAQNIDPLADYPLPYTEVDLSYFDDALFIGDSRVAGLAMNSGTNATFYAVTSFQLYKYKTFKVVQTPSGKVPIFDAMPYDKFTKIYIKVGLNELGTVTDEPFINDYTNLINDLRAMQPRAIIYIQAILPVTQVKSQTDRVHCNENIQKRNENLKSFAELMKCYYVDVGPYFADETGALRAETTADGIHMYGKYMPQWIDALRKNAVVWPPQN